MDRSIKCLRWDVPLSGSTNSANFPVLFPVSREFSAETGSYPTASSATDQAIDIEWKIPFSPVAFCAVLRHFPGLDAGRLAAETLAREALGKNVREYLSAGISW
jgi:hypothetical protein